MSDKEVVRDIEDLSRLKGGDEENRDYEKITKETLGREEAEISRHLDAERMISTNTSRRSHANLSNLAEI